MVYGLWFEEFSGGLSILTSKALWKSEPSLLFGTVSSLSWSPCLSYGQLRLAVASGNAVTVLDWTNVLPETTGFNPWAIPDVHQIADAHDGLVSSVAVVVDNSFLSSSLDGKICRWVVEQWDQGEAKEPLHVVHCGILHSGPPSEPIMAMQRTPLGFGVAAMTTVTRFGIEVNDHNEDAKRKYCAGARRSLLSMYIKPALEGTSEAAQQILGSVEARATTRRFVGEAIVMWEVELFLQQLQGAHASIVLAALRQRFRNMLGHLRGRSIPNLSQERFYHYVRVIACLSRVIIRVSGAGEDDGGLMTLQHGEISKNVRCIHYDSCMASFLQSKTPVNALSLDEIRALESMCHYVAKCDHELFWDAAATLERIRLVRAALFPRKASMPLPCIVCGPDSDVALKSDAQNPNVFRCSMNDCFERCVLTALPCTDVVPRVCYACDSKALVKDFDPFEERGKEFQWISNVGRCPICLCVLVPSSVEAH
ncbi:unnamed protein product [Chondrus crispus]|uniref:Transcription factor IIIC 90kDa subunit N-terminal domain-containing protein n=1 Tax=Chondrus crispus TaxID=2769 RepID=R7QIM2_CHOCR|nr:unnamed protein product [Chondrus crispus]CDF37593.1 unnamed protein product [Chondrus crispus]|eukprot:XP_005717464.1 unnamed protein product [Chondrus crispus]